MVVFLVLVTLPMEVGQRVLATVMSDAPTPPGLEESTRAHTALFWGGVQMVVDAPMYLELAAEAGVPVLIVFLLLLATALAAPTGCGRGSWASPSPASSSARSTRSRSG